MTELLDTLKSASEEARRKAAYDVSCAYEGSQVSFMRSMWALPSHEQLRQQVQQAVRRGPSPRAKVLVPPLANALSDSSAFVRAAAAQSLKYIGPDAQAAVSQLKTAWKDADPTVRRDVAVAFYQITAEAIDEVR